jgi:hypothetical protein
MISMIHRWVFGVKPIMVPIDLPGHGVVNCPRCHTYLRTGFALSLMGHLERDHQMQEDVAIDTATRMLDLLYKARLSRK